MKIKNVFDLIFSMENLYGALEDASDQRRYNKDVMLFNFNAWDNLKEIRDSVYDGTYTIDKYYIFYVYEPKKRMIMSIKFKHRVVQWAIYRVINPMLIKGYIKDSYGCIPERGPLTAMFRLKYWLEQVNRKDEQWYYLKLDISKYFYRISHRILKKILAKKIKDQRLLKLLESIIDCKILDDFVLTHADMKQIYEEGGDRDENYYRRGDGWSVEDYPVTDETHRPAGTCIAAAWNY